MKLSARNVLPGTIKRIVTVSVNSGIVVALGNGIEITSILTKASAETLKLKEGKRVTAVIKATNVIKGSYSIRHCFLRLSLHGKELFL